jgi:nitrogen fixation protein NifQ
MDPEGTYAWMIGPPRRRPADRFDVHVHASIFTTALMETGWGASESLTRALGLTFDEAVAVIAGHFPHALIEIGPTLADEPVERAEAEGWLLDLLWRSAADKRADRCRLAKMVARRAGRPNRLWEDLGLRNPGELSTLMSRHFPKLARRNAHDLEWKRFLYGAVCRDPDALVCMSDSCLDCDSFFACFGEGSGESLQVGCERLADAPTLARVIG